MARRVLYALLLVAACGTSGDDDGNDDDVANRDGGPVSTRDAGPVMPSVQIGTGEDRFEVLMDGDDIELIAGPQGGGRDGGLHLWSGARMMGIAKADIQLLTFTVTSTDGGVRSTVQRTGAAPIQMDTETGALQLIAIPNIIDDCCLVAEQQATMRVVVEMKSGLTYEDAVTVDVSVCPGPSEPGNDNFCD
ncbi:MAG: hypothetical protein RIT81_42630 [Deltaproteobacteria bacterium]